MRFQTVTNQYNQVQKRMNDMSKAVAKLASFKQSVMASLADDTDLDLSGEGGVGKLCLYRRGFMTPQFQDERATA